jgi:hypothetical protein
MKFDLSDALVFIGWLGAMVGIWLIFPPAAYIAAGVSLMYLGLSGNKGE